jgi:hypothetical protein
LLVPITDVEIEFAFVLLVPPVALVPYHNTVLPVVPIAFNVIGVASLHSLMSETTGVIGNSILSIVIILLLALGQPETNTFAE